MAFVKIVAMSDSHNAYNKLIIPPCDILIDTGDYSSKGYKHEVENFYKWLNKQEANHIISVQGNHELGWEANEEEFKKIALEKCPAVHLLKNESINIEGINIWGSPYTPYFFNWAYNAGRNQKEADFYKKPLIKDIWDKIPENTDVLLTHGPPYEILDELVYVDGTPKGQFVGCEELLKRIKEVKPDLHLFGHVHCGHGQKHIDGTSFYNVAVCDEMYRPSNGITVINYEI